MAGIWLYKIQGIKKMYMYGDELSAWKEGRDD